jgi:hypothetical protein
MLGQSLARDLLIEKARRECREAEQFTVVGKDRPVGTAKYCFTVFLTGILLECFDPLHSEPI